MSLDTKFQLFELSLSPASLDLSGPVILLQLSDHLCSCRPLFLLALCRVSSLLSSSHFVIFLILMTHSLSSLVYPSMLLDIFYDIDIFMLLHLKLTFSCCSGCLPKCGSHMSLWVGCRRCADFLSL